MSWLWQPFTPQAEAPEPESYSQDLLARRSRLSAGYRPNRQLLSAQPQDTDGPSLTGFDHAQVDRRITWLPLVRSRYRFSSAQDDSVAAAPQPDPVAGLIRRSWPHHLRSPYLWNSPEDLNAPAAPVEPSDVASLIRRAWPPLGRSRYRWSSAQDDSAPVAAEPEAIAGLIRRAWPKLGRAPYRFTLPQDLDAPAPAELGQVLRRPWPRLRFSLYRFHTAHDESFVAVAPGEHGRIFVMVDRRRDFVMPRRGDFVMPTRLRDFVMPPLEEE